MLKSFRQGLSAPALTHTISSPAEIESLKLYIDAQEFGTITFATGSGDGAPIASVTGVDTALGVVDESTGTAFLYEATGVNGKPSFKKGASTSIFKDENGGVPRVYNGTATIVYFFTGIFDNTSNTGPIFCFANTYAAIEAVNSTSIEYVGDENLSAVPITGSYNISGLTMVALSIASDASASVKVNDLPLQTFDPSNGWDNNGSIRFGTSTSTIAGLHHELYGAMVYDRALPDDELGQLYEWGIARYG